MDDKQHPFSCDLYGLLNTCSNVYLWLSSVGTVFQCRVALAPDFVSSVAFLFHQLRYTDLKVCPNYINLYTEPLNLRIRHQNYSNYLHDSKGE